MQANFSEGAVAATDGQGKRLHLFLGIIDILQCYTAVKLLEHAVKGVAFGMVGSRPFLYLLNRNIFSRRSA